MSAARRWRTVRSSRGMTPGMMHHPTQGVVVADPTGQRFGRDQRRDPRDVTQQGDLSDDRARGRLSDEHPAVGVDVSELGAARRD